MRWYTFLVWRGAAETEKIAIDNNIDVLRESLD